MSKFKFSKFCLLDTNTSGPELLNNVPISGELLAVAKLSRPLEKNFTKELLVRVKLDF